MTSVAANKPRRSRRLVILVESFAVVAIIGMVTYSSMLSLADGHADSRNAARVLQVREYQKAFNLHYSAHGFYPRSNATIRSGAACLGDYAPFDMISGSCGQSGSTVFEQKWFVDSIVPLYLPKLPQVEELKFGENPYYSGIYYQYGEYGKSYALSYFMQGQRKDCVIKGAVSIKVGGDTLCTITVNP
jgi:hypothetical protein